MEDSLLERCLRYREHISQVTGATCVLMDIKRGVFDGAPFSPSCHLSDRECDAYTTHLYGAYEAERWDGKYIYYCPRGLIFIATPVHVPHSPMEYCLITGPIIMSNFPDDMAYGDLTDLTGLSGVPHMTTAQTRSLSEIIRATAGYLAGEESAPDVDSGSQAEMLQMLYDISSDLPESERGYPIDSERKLQQMVRDGDKEGSQALLNQLLGNLYFSSGADFKVIKNRVTELLTLMSRATIEGGADVSQVLWLNDGFVGEVEQQTDIVSLSCWLGAAVHRFISCVFDFSDVKHRDVVFKITEYIKRNMTEKLNISDAAGHVYLSKSHLSRILRQELGCTFTEYVNRLRVDRSKVCLLDPRNTLADVAGKVGFEDQSYFTKVFKKLTGVTPGKYREQRM